MDFSLNQEQQMIQDAVRKFSHAQIMPHSHDWEQAKAFPRDLLYKMGELGYLGVPIPEEYGGSGLGMHICYNLVTQRLRGSIRCDSAPGRGVHFALRLPRESRPVAALAG